VVKNDPVRVGLSDLHRWNGARFGVLFSVSIGVHLWFDNDPVRRRILIFSLVREQLLCDQLTEFGAPERLGNKARQTRIE
jgi:hypothetical protein